MKNLSFVFEEKKIFFQCGNCEDNVEVIGQCNDCCEFLCDKCIVVYCRVCVIREYYIIFLNELMMEEEDNNNLCNFDSCVEYKCEDLIYFCQMCDKFICCECIIVSYLKLIYVFEFLKEVFEK